MKFRWQALFFPLTLTLSPIGGIGANLSKQWYAKGNLLNSQDKSTLTPLCQRGE